MTLHVEHSSISNDVTERLRRFAEKLTRWNEVVNLVSPADLPVLWPRHIEDCLQLIPLMRPWPARGIDLGSGGGFPGLVLAIATGIPFDLIESDRRKAAFLREAARETVAPAAVHSVRIEAARIQPAGLVTARALAKLPLLLDLAAPKLTPDGYCLFLKGASAPDELTQARAQWHMRVEQTQSRTDRSAAILRISEIARVKSD